MMDDSVARDVKIMRACGLVIGFCGFWGFLVLIFLAQQNQPPWPWAVGAVVDFAVALSLVLVIAFFAHRKQQDWAEERIYLRGLQP